MAISYLSSNGVIDCCFFSPLIIFFHFILLEDIEGYAGLTRHIRFIISRGGTIMVIDTVTSLRSSSVIAAYCTGIQEAGGGGAGATGVQNIIMGV